MDRAAPEGRPLYCIFSYVPAHNLAACYTVCRQLVSSVSQHNIMPSPDQNATPTTPSPTPASAQSASPAAASAVPDSHPEPEVIVDGASLSLIWAEAIPQFLLQKIPSSSPWAVLTRSDTYRKTFDQTQKNVTLNLDPVQPPHVQPPWRAGQKQFFWMRYLVQGDLNAVAGVQAWRTLVPFRTAPPYTLEPDDSFNGKIAVQTFYYPFGTALSITIVWGPHLAPEQLVQSVFELRHTQKFKSSASPKLLDLDQFASATLKALREQCLGIDATTGRQSQEPFTVLTVTNAPGVDSSIDIKSQPASLKVLEAFANWRPDWATGTLPLTSETCLPTKKTAPAGSALYARERGRAIWFPALFTPPFSKRSTLTCYHHNLAFAALHVEALALLMGHTAAEFKDGKQKIDLTASHRACAQNAAVQLSSLYLGDKGVTWRSASAQRHIRDACLEDLKTVLAAFGEKSLP